MYAIVVHGGAGNWPRERHADALAGVEAAAATGARQLADGASALDSATAAVVALEDDPLFNAGTGSVLCLDGEVEMDAAVMRGSDLGFGAVACLKRVRNPVLVARQVLERTEHALLAGDGAFLFARAHGYSDYDPITAERREQWRRCRRALADAGAAGGRLARLLAAHPELGGDTVGAVALDRQGDIATATSTGGIALQLPGRVGDSPIPGAGTYATGHCGVSATGRGEHLMRLLVAKDVCDGVAAGEPLARALRRVIAQVAERFGPDSGLIGLDRAGNVGAAHGAPAMPHAWAGDQHDGVSSAMRASAPEPDNP